MRFLCLHGVGSSGAICEKHFQPLLAAVDPSYEFVFVDGPISSVRGPGMAAAQGPFFSQCAGYSPTQMREAMTHLDAVIEDLVPFDGVIGFSQGAAMAISYMFDHLERRQHLPFAMALLFSTVCAFSADRLVSLHSLERIRDGQRSFVDMLERPDLVVEERALAEAFCSTILPLQDEGALLPDIDMSVYSEGDDVDAAPRLLLPESMPVKISLPVFHMHGKRDTRYMQAMSLTSRRLFDPRVSKATEHAGSHEPPKGAVDVRTAARGLEWAIALARKSGRLG